jgi:aldose 1-epimerase
MAVKVEKVATHEGQSVLEAILSSDAGVAVNILGYGGRIRDWRVPVANELRSVVLGYPNAEPYFTDTSYFGAIVGRVANRIAGACFQLNGKTYTLATADGPHQLHGGPLGLSQKVWHLEADSTANAVHLSVSSPDGEMGYPGAVDFSVTYRLKDFRLHIEMEARTDVLTPINMAHHSYFNLCGRGDVLDHRLRVNANAYTVVDDELIPTGEIRAVTGTRYDFSRGRTLRTEAGEPVPYDINLVLDPRRRREEAAAVLRAPDGAIELKLWTDQPGLQVYNGIHLGFTGLCLEDQKFPDAVNKPQFPPAWVSPESPYVHHCAIEIAGGTP